VPTALVVALVAAAACASDGWSEPELIAEHVPGGRAGIPVRALVEPDGRSFVCWSEGEIGAWRAFVAERDSKGTWKRTRLVETNQTADPEPQIARGADGTIVVAWGGAADKPGGGFSALMAGAKEWTTPQRLHAKCEGRVALTSGEKPVAAYVRTVTKLDLPRLFGDFVHDPPVQGFEKLGVAQLDGSGWTETAILDSRGLLRCANPALADGGAIYFRQADTGSEELAWSTLTGKDAPETISTSRAFRFGTEAAVTSQGGDPVVVFQDEKGVVMRRRTKAGWGDPRPLFPGWGSSIRLAATPDTIHVAWAAPGRVRYAKVTGDGIEVAPDLRAGMSCDISIHGGQAALAISEFEKETGLTTAVYRIVWVRGTK